VPRFAPVVLNDSFTSSDDRKESFTTSGPGRAATSARRVHG